MLSIDQHTKSFRDQHRLKRMTLAALVGALPGLALMAINIVFITGEAQLSVGIGAIFLTIGGLAVGLALGAQRDLGLNRAAVGALAGAMPGVAAFFAPGTTRLAPLILIAGAIAGGIIAGRNGNRQV